MTNVNPVFFISLKKFNLGLLTDNEILQRDVLLTYIFFCTIFQKNQSFSDHPALSCQIAFENEKEQLNLSCYCICEADSESLRLFFLNNRLQCSNDANRLLETFYGFCYQAVDKFIPKKTVRRSKAPHWMSSHSVNAVKFLQTALKHDYSDEKIKHCKQDLNDSLELDKAVYFESMKDFDLKMAYKLFRSINGKTKVPRKMSYRITSLCSDFAI